MEGIKSLKETRLEMSEYLNTFLLLFSLLLMMPPSPVVYFRILVSLDLECHSIVTLLTVRRTDSF